MKILVTGGAGFLGINFIRYLLAKGVKSITSLDFASFTYPEKNKVEVIDGDIRDHQTVAGLMKNKDIVIHAAAALPLYSKQEIYSTDVEGTGIILEQAFKNGVKRVIHISSTAVYGIPDHHPLYENDKLDGVGYYGHAKIMAERVCENYRKKGFCVPIIRPKSFIGPERLGVFALLFDWAKDGKNFPMIGNGRNRYQLLDVEDLCQAIYLCMTLDKKMVNDTFNIGAKEFGTMKQDFQAVLDYVGYGKRIVAFPAWISIIGLKVLERLKLSPLYKWVYETAGKDSFVSIEKAEKILKFKPKYSNQAALIRNFQWYMDNLENFSGQAGISHRVPWNQGILKLVKLLF